MSINKIKEFAIHYHSFRNIDLLNQGLYQIKTKVYYKKDKINSKEKEKEKFYGIPYLNLESKEIEEFNKNEDPITKPHNVLNAHISNSSFFLCKTFLIKYSDEEVEMNDFCYFKIESESNNKAFFIDFELYFSENISQISFKTKQKSNQFLSKIEYKLVNTVTITIHEDNIFFNDTFIPIMFQDSYSSILNINLNFLTTDFKLRKEELKVFSFSEAEFQDYKKTSEELSKDDENKNSQKLKDVNTSNQKKEELNKSKNSKKVKKQICPNYLLEYFINNDQLNKIHLIYNQESNSLLPNYVDALYDSFVLSLMNSYNMIRLKYIKLAECFISDNNSLIEDSFFTSLNQFIYYTDVSDLEFPIIDESDFNFQENKPILRRFSKRLASLNVDYVLNRVLMEISLVSAQLNQLWHKYLELLRYFPNKNKTN